MSFLSDEENQRFLNWLPAIILYSKNKEKQLIKMSLVITATVLISILSAYSLAMFIEPSEEGAIWRESSIGEIAALYNLLFYLLITGIFSVIIYFLLKHRRLNVLMILQMFLLGLACGSTASMVIPIWFLIIMALFVSALQVNISLESLVFIFNIISDGTFLVFFLLAILALSHNRFRKIRNPLLLVTGTWAGAILGMYTGKLTPLFLMLGFGLYDLFTVFYGPLKKLSEEINIALEEKEKEIGAEFAKKEKQTSLMILGLGDIFFYSLAISYSQAYFSFSAMIYVAIMTVIGAFATIIVSIKISESREKKTALPALPIPMLLSGLILLYFIIFG
ncbi:MAG: hypothetical protein ACP6IQ_04090 [Candidatus Njordarchaeia archaeon]